MKASITQLKDSYNKHGNIWKVAEEFGMCGQSVWERLKRHGIIHPLNVLTEEEKEKISELYREGFEPGDKKLDNLSKEINRTKPFISRYAKSIGLTNIKRKKSPPLCAEISEKNKKWHQNNPHPRGMLGKTHSPEYCKQLSEQTKQWYITADEYQILARSKKMLKTKLNKYGTIAPHLKNYSTSWKQGWREIGGKRNYYRSSWEANYGRYLEYLKQNHFIHEWYHEPKTFWFEKIKRGALSYLPDFKVEKENGSHYWVEVKGYMCSRSKTKIKRFRKQFPEEELLIINEKWFKSNAKKLKAIIKDWE